MAKFMRRRWHRYKFRFVPWIATEFGRQVELSQLNVSKTKEWKIDEEKIKKKFTGYIVNLRALHEEIPYESTASTKVSRWKERLFMELDDERADLVKSHTTRHFGFFILCLPSSLGHNAGLGVFVVGDEASSADTIVASQGDLVAIYPGTFYSPGEPLFWTSLGNQFIFRCADGMLLDGNNKALSASIFRSLLYRDSIPHIGFVAADSSWMTFPPRPFNPLAVGQYVNNAVNRDVDNDVEAVNNAESAFNYERVKKKFSPNVTYHEIALRCPLDVPLECLQYLPYLYYDSKARWEIQNGDREFKCVILIATRNIFHGEELFSSYFSLVKP